MEDAKKVLSEIKEGTTKCAASRKDEVNAMKAIINDPDFVVDVYGNAEPEQYYPGRELRKVVSNTIANVVHMPHKEASELLDQYEFNRSDATALVDLSKEFVSSYLQTGRKLPLGARKTSNIELMWKNIPDREAKIPSRNGERTTVFIAAHGGVGASNPCPEWVAKKNKK